MLILIDDLSHYGVTAYGADRMNCIRKGQEFENVRIATPRMDKLAGEGVRFDRAFTYPLCESTRIALMSGKDNRRNYLKPKSQHASDITFGDIFQAEGYRTGMFGKWKQTRGTKEVPGREYISEFGWDEYVCFDVIGGGQRFINPNLVVNGKVVNYKGRTDLDPVTGRRWYGPDLCNRAALKFIEDNKDEPFFLYYPMLLVHDDHKPTPDTEPASDFDTFDEESPYVIKGRGDDARYFPDMLAYTDKLIGKLVDKLEAEGLRDDTLIVLMGDNGTKEIFQHVFPDGSIYPGRKGGNTDNGIHVPLIVSQPGRVESGKVYDGLTYLTDVLPSICDATGISHEKYAEVDGISFWEQMEGASGEPRDSICTWYSANFEYTQKEEIFEYAFNKDFKRYSPTTAYPEGRFFDLRTDPLELEGDRFVARKWGVRWYSGLDLKNLTPEQQEGYDELGMVLEAHRFVAVEGLRIRKPVKKMKEGESRRLKVELIPSGATRTNVVWESSDPSVATVDKFGNLRSHKAGKATIAAFSWDDAFPTSANRKVTYHRDGISDSFELMVK
ncbi:sulfatase-like hydrolase/transferase [Pelagicoccus mobilis]|uniref:Sulfatase-like hydrolase/transferase n=1 Tax=Pelagicoccus mobilis TaxID=415221 RepID=A0A934VPH0_9BACT|nr:sulfatase-like hydrolase/transferase [Pelagicoccus mobilis]MBK1875524.1 sulfatase-like hydrolase/transferase [Pelagicoccus mobilis]